MKLLVSVAGEDGWYPGQEVEVDDETADKWCDGERAVLVEETEEHEAPDLAEVERLRKCAVCDDISDPFIMQVGLCYRHAASDVNLTEVTTEALLAELDRRGEMTPTEALWAALEARGAVTAVLGVADVPYRVEVVDGEATEPKEEPDVPDVPESKDQAPAADRGDQKPKRGGRPAGEKAVQAPGGEKR